MRVAHKFKVVSDNPEGSEELVAYFSSLLDAVAHLGVMKELSIRSDIYGLWSADGERDEGVLIWAERLP